MAKYSEKAQQKIEEVMSEFKEGELKSGSGEKVKDRDQAIAIGISEARERGYKVPKVKKDKARERSKLKPARHEPSKAKSN
jgi:hypothetical protein